MILEICVDSVESALRAQEGGAARVELNDNMLMGGTTPSLGTIQVARKYLTIELLVMIRPRGGDFCYSDLELEVMERDLAAAQEAGADGVVFGVLRPDGTVDLPRMERLMAQAAPLPVTFHRAFDVCADPFRALEELVALGVRRILTSGQAPTVLEGRHLLRELIARAAGRLTILPGGGITEDNADLVVRELGVDELHAYLPGEEPSPMFHRNPRVFMGGALLPPEYTRSWTDPARVRGVLQAMERSKG
jgi:copper homeostasis protein